MKKIPSYLLNLAGEYRICSELTKRGILATITYGTHKGVDVYAISDRKERALKIEVKTSQRSKFVTSLTKKGLVTDPLAPDFWVLYQILSNKADAFEERFFVLTHQEMCKAQAARNAIFARRYFERNHKQFDFAKGVDGVLVEDVNEFEDQWAKIIVRIGEPASP